MVVVDKQKGKKTIKVMLPYTTGLAFLPEDGGIMDQPYRMMEFFAAFLDGERIAFDNRLK